MATIIIKLVRRHASLIPCTTALTKTGKTGDANVFYLRMYLQQEAGKTDTSKQNKTSAAQQMHY